MATLHPDGRFTGTIDELLEIERRRRSPSSTTRTEPGENSDVAEVLEHLNRDLTAAQAKTWSRDQVRAVLKAASAGTVVALRHVLALPEGTPTKDVMKQIDGLPAYVRSLRRYAREVAPELPTPVVLKGRPGATVLAINPEFRVLATEVLTEKK